MGYAALYSGGKDSSLALWEAQSLGLNVDTLITVYPERDYSYMFHKSNIHLVPKLAKSIGIELIEIETAGEKETELHDLRKGMKELEVSGLITGAVASSYQMDRIKKIASDLSLDVFAPLWNMSQSDLLERLVDEEFKAFIVSVSALGLDKEWLGRTLDKKCLEDLKKLEKKHGINISGEGGEYETLVLDGPNYQDAFEIDKKEKFWDGRRGELKIKNLKKR